VCVCERERETEREADMSVRAEVKEISHNVIPNRNPLGEQQILMVSKPQKGHCPNPRFLNALCYISHHTHMKRIFFRWGSSGFHYPPITWCVKILKSPDDQNLKCSIM